MTRARRRGWWWLVLAAALLSLGAWVMLGAEPPPRPQPPSVSLPRKMKPIEMTRATERRTWTPTVVDAGGVVAALAPARPRDPLLSLMPETVERGAVVAEVNAIVNSELGGLLFDCVTAGGRGDLDLMRDAGFDPKVHLDRIAVIDDAVVMTGQLGSFPFPKGSVTRDYGPRAKLVAFPGEQRTVGLWNNQLYVSSGDEATTRAIIDRLERGDASARPVLDDAQAYGEVYGVVAPKALADLFGDDDPRVRDLVVGATKGLALHVDVSHDVGVVADVQMKDATKTDDLRKSIGSLLSIARLRAQNLGRTDEADLLDLARVRGADGAGFRVEAGVPHELVKSMLQRCVDRQQRRAVERAARQNAAPRGE